jgi:hypothetical protein
VSDLERYDNNLTVPDHLPATDPVRALRVAITGMADDAQTLAEQGDWEALIRGLEPLQQVLGDLRDLERDVKGYIADTMPESRVSVDGVGTVERKAQITRRNWQSDDLLALLVRRALVDETTGEIPSSPMEAVANVLREVKACVPFTGSTGWRVGALRDRGLTPDEWCDENLNGFTIKFTRDRSEG